MPFDRLIGVLAFLALIPLIILYLYRPKSSNQTIPSLMFFIKERGSSKFLTFFKRLLVNFLFFLQFAIISLLAFSLTGFFIEIPSQKESTVIVLDVSGSMQASFEGKTRFKAAVDEALKNLEGKISIVFSSNVPQVALEKGSAGEARKILRIAEPYETSSNIGDAILVASEIAEGKGQIIVLSDFIATEGADPLIVKTVLPEKVLVKFISFRSEANNVGIISIEPGKKKTAVLIKNFNQEDQEFKVQLINDQELKDEKEFTIKANSLEEFFFDTLPGKTEIKLVIDGGLRDLPADNSAYLYLPPNFKVKTLLLTDSENSNLQAALEVSPDLELKVSKPSSNANFADYEVIILHEFKVNETRKEVYEKIEEAVMQGASFVITGQKDLEEAEIKFLPVELKGTANNSVNVLRTENQFTKDVDFGASEVYLIAEPKDSAIVLVSSSNSTSIALEGQGKGKVFYYGIIDEFASFKTSITYPQFWSRVPSLLAEKEGLEEFNFRTGFSEPVEKQRITTPSGSFESDRVIFNKAGFYEYGSKTVAASMANLRESDINAGKPIDEYEEKSVATKKSEFLTKQAYEFELALLALILIFAELLFIKSRGDL